MSDRLDFMVPSAASAPPKQKAAEPDPLEGGDVYKGALEQSALSRKRFPDTCRYDWDMIMTRPFVLEQTDEVS